MSEADVHFEFYRHLQNEIDDDPSRNGIGFSDARPEYGEGMDGFSDIVIFDGQGSPFIVIEAKSPNGRSRREIDPYSPKVIRQAFRYAGDLGAPYFATFNGDRLVIFDAYEEGIPLLERSTKSYEISSLKKFAGTFLDEISRIRAGDARWDANDDAFVERIKSLHEKIVPKLKESLSEHLEEDDEFRSDFEDSTASQGIDYQDASESDKKEILEEFTEQAAYLLINKILFYRILESSATYSSELTPLAVSPFRVQEDLEEYFQHVVDEVDFEAVFEHDEIYSEIPLGPVSERIRDFILELDEHNLTQFDSDVIGRIYEGVIPPERRKTMGEYYTPPAICDLITRLTIDDAHANVLDPACGSGGFLVSAYQRKQELMPEEKGSHTVLLSQILGVDVNRFPAHLSAINLSLQDLSTHTENVNVEVNDFFNVSPDTQRFGRVTAGAGGSEWEQGNIEETIGGFDAVVANPPYIRGRNLTADQKQNSREHLSDVDAKDITKRMDIYGYFLTHSTQFLQEGGRLGFIVNDTWLSTGYGTDLQKFILDNYRIDAIIKLDQQAFEDALVGSTILILTRDENEQSRNDNVAKFIRVLDSIQIDELEEAVEEDLEADQMVFDENLRTVTRRQGTLYEEEKWTIPFRAPPIYYDLFAHESVVELSEVSDISRGISSGANPFFYSRSEEWEELGLEEYTTPLLKASGQVSRIRCTEEDAGEWGVLDLHDIVQPALEAARDVYEDVDEEKYVKEWLIDEGHEVLVEYINSGEDSGYHERPTMNSRTLWFNLGDLTYPPMFIPDFTWRVHRVLWCEEDVVSDRQFYHIVPHD